MTYYSHHMTQDVEQPTRLKGHILNRVTARVDISVGDTVVAGLISDRHAVHVLLQR